MATTSKLTASNGYYGYAEAAKFSNSAANHLYVGGAGGAVKYVYRSRMTFKALSTIAAIGSSRIKISRILLYLHRNGEGPTTITVGCSSSSAWNASLAAAKSVTIDDTTKWYAVDITSMAAAIGGYKSNWYIHLRNGTPRLRLSGTSSSYIPYIKVTWEYVAATISSDSDEAELGQEMSFAVAPEAEGETHTLTYSIGDQSGTIAERAGDSIPWTPPLDLATEFTSDDTGTATIRMTAYNAAGSVLRTELYYQTLRAPDSMKPAVHDLGLTIGSEIGGYGLTGRTALTLAPAIDMDACCGALLDSIKATIANGDTVQELIWTNTAEEDPGIYVGAALTGAVLETAGEAVVHLIATDSRGRTAEATQTVQVLAYTPPQISAFSVERYEAVYDANEEISGYAPGDLGGYVWVNINAAVCEIAPEGEQLNALAWRIDGVSLARSAVSAEGTGDQAVSIAQDRDIFPDAVDEGETWQYTLTVTDTAGGAAAQYSVVLPAHAALSVSPDKYGLAIGMIASGSKVRPKFEVAEDYESHFYGGLFGADGYRMDKAVKWEYLNISHNSFTYSSEAQKARIARVGPLVFLEGAAKNTVALSAGFSAVIATLPEWARPAYNTYAIHQGSGRGIYWLLVGAGGDVNISRHRSEAGNLAASAGSTFMLTACWIAKDAYV